MLRWTFSLGIALALHAFAIDMLLAESRDEATPLSPPPAILVDLDHFSVEPEILANAERITPPDASPPLPATEASTGTATSTEPLPTCEPHAEAAVESGGPATLKEWKGLLQYHLDRHKRYPVEAQQKGQQGTPHIHFTMCRDGRVLEAHILQTSGFAMLDQADMVRSADPLPVLPQGNRATR